MGKHRSHGEGSLYRRQSDSRWVAYVTLPDGRKRYCSGRTRAICSDRWQRLKDDLAREELERGPDQTIRQFVTRWLSDTVRPNTSPGTYRSYESAMRLHVLPVIGDAILRLLTPQQVSGIQAEMSRRGLSATTRRHVHTILASALNLAVDWDLIRRNPARRVPLPSPPRIARASLPLEMLPRFLQAIQGNALENLFVVALCSGLRLGELRGLQWRNVDLAGGTVAVTQQMQARRNEVHLVEVKQPSSIRVVYLPSVAVEALVREQSRQIEARLANPARWQNNDLVFAQEDGSPVPEHVPTRTLARIARDAGLPHVTMHALRRTYTRYLMRAGADPRTAAELLGHASPMLTMSIYDESNPERKRLAANRLGELL